MFHIHFNIQLMTDSNHVQIKSKKNGRPKKIDIFQKERNEILNKLFVILNINENNKVFYVDDIQNDDNKKNAILALKDDVKKYFKSSNWSVFHKQPPNQWLSLSKSIIKACGNKLTTIYEMNDNCKSINKKGYKVV